MRVSAQSVSTNRVYEPLSPTVPNKWPLAIPHADCMLFSDLVFRIDIFHKNSVNFLSSLPPAPILDILAGN